MWKFEANSGGLHPLFQLTSWVGTVFAEYKSY